jgi:hypothetical protein
MAKQFFFFTFSGNSKILQKGTKMGQRKQRNVKKKLLRILLGGFQKQF